MAKLKKSQSLRLLPIAALLMATPLISSSLRFKYLYLIVNVLIIAVGAEAGLLSFFLQSAQNKRQPLINISSSDHQVSPSPHREINNINAAAAHQSDSRGTNITYNNSPHEQVPVNQPVKAVRKYCPSDMDIFVGVKVKKSPSTPSPTIFFIAEEEQEKLVEDDHNYEVGVGEDTISGQELFQKAETFIGNFYKQLKMQREESWNKELHHLSHKPF